MANVIFTFPQYFLLIISALVKVQINGYPDGAPPRDEICESMRPGHFGESSLGSDPPFDIKLDRVYIRGTGKINIKVESKDPSRYSLTGFIFMVKKPNSMNKAYGTFDPSLMKDDLKTIPCFGKEGSALTHSSNRKKTAVSFDWIAPNDTSAIYEFHASLVRDYNSFWADITFPRKIEVSVNAPKNHGISYASAGSMFFLIWSLCFIQLIT